MLPGSIVVHCRVLAGLQIKDVTAELPCIRVACLFLAHLASTALGIGYINIISHVVVPFVRWPRLAVQHLCQVP